MESVPFWPQTRPHPLDALARTAGGDAVKEKIIKTIPWAEAKDGVFIDDTYCANAEEVFDYLSDCDPEDRPTQGIAARRVDYKPRNFYDDIMDDLYQHGPEGITDDPYPSIAAACDNLTAAIKTLDLHWFEPMDNLRSAVYVALPEVTP